MRAKVMLILSSLSSHSLHVFHFSDVRQSKGSQEPFDPAKLPSTEKLSQLIDRIEAMLPKEDHVKYDSR